MYKFDPKKDAATALIEVLPHRFVDIYTVKLDEPELDGKGNPNLREHQLYLGVKDEMQKDGKMRGVWDSEHTGRMWVTPEIANELTVAVGEDAKHNIPPIAALRKSRSVEVALGLNPREYTGLGDKDPVGPSPEKKARRQVEE